MIPTTVLFLSLLSLRAEAAPPTTPANEYRWQHEGTRDQIALYRDGKRIGVYSFLSRLYFPCEGQSFGDPRTAPIDPPQPCTDDSCPREPQGPVRCPNYGLDLDKIQRSRSYSVTGRETTQREAYDRLKEKLSDDSQKLRVTIIGSAEACDQVRHDIESHPALAGVKDRVHLHTYRPDDPMIRCGFTTTGNPVIYFQSPDGKVLHRQDEYAGAQKLADAVRRADPHYQPASDPNLNDPLTRFKQVPPAVYFIAGLAIFAIASMRKQPTKLQN